jgi:hypothetical protein
VRYTASPRPRTQFGRIDWARGDTYELTTGIAKKVGGAYGLGVTYAKTMFGAHEG